MKKLIPLLLLFLCSCSTDYKAEKNIESFLTEYVPLIKIRSSEYSSLLIASPLDTLVTNTYHRSFVMNDKLSTDDRINGMVDYLLPTGLNLIKDLNRHNMDSFLRNDELYQDLNAGANKYIKVGFFELEDQKGNVENVGLGFIIDTLYNVTQILPINNDKDYNYIYHKLVITDKL